jgi:hypothetical protein
VLKKGEAFNLEKESKIINPHKMDTGTTSNNTYKNFKVEPKEKLVKRADTEKKPIIGASAYAKAFPNWKNG